MCPERMSWRWCATISAPRLQVAQAEGIREQATERARVAVGRIANADNQCSRAEFIDDLATRAAGRIPEFRLLIDGDRFDRFLARRDGGEDRGALGAIAESIRRVFDVGA